MGVARGALAASPHVIKRGDVFRRSQKFCKKVVTDFLKLTGDTNKIHTDVVAAKAAGFAAPPVPGILCASLFPTIIARNFPGAVYLTQTLQFRRPIPVNSTVRAEVTVTQVHGSHVRLNTVCTEKEGGVLIEGVALAKIEVLPAIIPETAPGDTQM